MLRETASTYGYDERGLDKAPPRNLRRSDYRVIISGLPKSGWWAVLDAAEVDDAEQLHGKISKTSSDRLERPSTPMLIDRSAQIVLSRQSHVVELLIIEGWRDRGIRRRGRSGMCCKGVMPLHLTDQLDDCRTMRSRSSMTLSSQTRLTGATSVS